MLKILIVDDEPLVRMGLRETIEWQNYGFEIIAEAEDCEDGFEKYIKYSPDIVISDIRMGKSSGLDLVEKIHSCNPDTELVILSGYEQFDYARRAMESGISVYLLKPVENDELLSTMLALKEKIEAKKMIAGKLDTLSEHIPYLKNKFINDLIHNKIDNKNAIYEKFNMYGITPPAENYIVANISIDNFNLMTDTEADEEDNLISETIDYIILNHNFNAFYGKISSCNYTLILSHHAEEYRSLNKFSTADFFDAIKEQFGMVSERTISIGISRSHKDITKINKGYLEAKRALSHRAISGKASIIDITNVPDGKSVMLSVTNEEIDTIVNAIKEVNYDRVFSTLENIFSRIESNSDLSAVRESISEMIIMVFRSIFKLPESVVDVFGYPLHPFSEVRKFDTVSGIKQWVWEVFNKLFENPNIYLQCTYHPEIQQAVATIMNNYQTPLTIEAVANDLYISPSYLMFLFKKETGKTFNTYLTEYRVQKAIELIKTDTYKIYEICKMVGYSDSNYFSQIFKKITGKTPKNYK